MIERRTSSAGETLALGRLLAPLLTVGDVIAISGSLGAGKTCLTAGIAEGLGVSDRIISPSFLIVRSYRDGFLPLYHADVYRLSSMAEFFDLELIDTAADGVLVVEWGRAVEQWLPVDHLAVDIEVADDRSRLFRFRQHGTWADRDLGALE